MHVCCMKGQPSRFEKQSVVEILPLSVKEQFRVIRLIWKIWNSCLPPPHLCMKLHIEIFTMRVLKFPIPGFSVRAAQSNSGLYGLDTFDPLFKYVVYHGCFPTPMLAYSWETVLNAYFILCVCATV